ncbi:hypothetical protein B0J12DRAFT_711482 [Macrophomina phaseolina]|uniref:Nudix hydrolase domain-containing protein n=1 Tax=Macrophomina phaseolina TaxID=35725 RepID=A0ABQ8G813_9PEZI|nr:hypothetical protein B0J12DRAFT_711482 [Macrophomina phaseolina]
MHRTIDDPAPVVAQYPCEHLVIGCGVAIFHVASARVVLCYHSRDRYWFLPKGRRDAGEETTRAAEREGFEESGYRNRLLPLPLPHRQPAPAHLLPAQPSSSTASRPSSSSSPSLPSFVTEPLWTQLVPVSPRTQYLLFWYAAETLPPDVEADMPPPSSAEPYLPPPVFPREGSLSEEVEREGKEYEPRRWEGTGVDAEEALYESELVPVGEAVRRLGEGGVMADVVERMAG